MDKEVKLTNSELLCLLSEICSYVNCVPLQTRNGFHAIRVNKTGTMASSIYSGFDAHELVKAIEKDLRNNSVFEVFDANTQFQLEMSGVTAKVNADRKAKLAQVEGKVELFRFWRPEYFLDK
jgi:hypothetical protein